MFATIASYTTGGSVVTGSSSVVIGRSATPPNTRNNWILGDSSLIQFDGVLAPPGFVLEGGSAKEGWVGKVGDRLVHIFWDPQTKTGRYLVDGEIISGEDMWVWFSPMYQSLRTELQEMKRTFNELYYAPGMPGAEVASSSFMNQAKTQRSNAQEEPEEDSGNLEDNP